MKGLCVCEKVSLSQTKTKIMKVLYLVMTLKRKNEKMEKIKKLLKQKHKNHKIEKIDIQEIKTNKLSSSLYVIFYSIIHIKTNSSKICMTFFIKKETGRIKMFFESKESEV